MTRVEVALRLDAALGECPVWDVERGVLHFADIFAERIHTFDPARGTVASVAVSGAPGALVLDRAGGWVAGLGLELASVAPDGQAAPLARATRGDRFNDARCDARGRLVAGTMDRQERVGAASVYRLDPDGALVALLDDVTLSNGIDWNAAGDRMYHVDTTARRVSAFDYDVATGRLGAREPFADLHDAGGRPDGLTVDAEGGVWVVVARGGKLHRYDERGRLDAVIAMPTPIVTSCAFGGRDLDVLYVTSSRALLGDEQRAQDPLAGALFVVEGLGVRGRAPNRFGAAAR